MRTHNPDNERVKRKYFAFLKEAKRQSEDSVDAAATALARFERDSKYRDFRAFHFEQAIAFKRRLANQDSQVTGEKLSKATQHATLAALRRFFQWLALQPGYKSKLNYTDAEYFSLSEKDTRVATARRERPAPTLEQIKHTLAKMPSDTDIHRRNRALLAFAILTGARDTALASLKLKHVDMVEGILSQDARDVKTKFSKSFNTWFFNVGDDVLRIAADWVEHLRRDLLWGNEDPLFPNTQVGIGPSRQFEPVGLLREHWSTASPIRAIFKQAFELAGLPYFNPHSFRRTLVQLGEKRCRTTEEFKSWSQNLGHEGVLTTLYSYGSVPDRRQGELIKALGEAPTAPASQADLMVEAFVRAMDERGMVVGQR